MADRISNAFDDVAAAPPAKPAFDPSQPFTTAPPEGAKPAFDPNAPFSTSLPPEMLPDVGAPAIPSGPQISAGVPAVNQAAQAASESVGKATTNLPGSAYQFGANAVHAVAHPVETVTGIGQLAAGVAQYAGVPGDQYKPYAEAAGKAIMERYGSLEKAKQTFENDPVGFAADVSSVLSGGAGLARGVGALPRRAARVAVPTTEELHTASTGNYNAMKGFGVELHPHVADQIATNIETELLNEGYRPRNRWEGHNQLFNAVNELRHPVGQYVTMSDIDMPRRALNRLAANPSLRDGARRAISELDTAMTQLTPADAAINGHFIPRVVQEAERARGNYAAFKHAETVENATNMAELQAASTGSGANIDNATRQKFRAILASPKQRRGFSQAELANMEQLVRGLPAGNAARLVGKLAPTGVVSGALSATLGHALGHTIGVPALGMASKAASDAITRHAAARISEQVRLRAPEARRLGATASPAVVPRFVSGVANQSRRLNLADRAGNPFANPSQ